jgi:hypothetical protein
VLDLYLDGYWIESKQEAVSSTIRTTQAGHPWVCYERTKDLLVLGADQHYSRCLTSTTLLQSDPTEAVSFGAEQKLGVQDAQALGKHGVQDLELLDGNDRRWSSELGPVVDLVLGLSNVDHFGFVAHAKVVNVPL